VDASGTPVGSSANPASINQSAVVSTGNSSTTNLDTGNSYTFDGAAVSTLPGNSIQVKLFADKDCIVEVYQADAITVPMLWDLKSTFHYVANSNGFGRTTQAISSYAKVTVTTNSETTTVFRLQTVICPIADPLPMDLDVNGNLRVATGMDKYGFQAENTPMDEVRVSEATRLVGIHDRRQCVGDRGQRDRSSNRPDWVGTDSDQRHGKRRYIVGVHDSQGSLCRRFWNAIPGSRETGCRHGEQRPPLGNRKSQQLQLHALRWDGCGG
jgi:hypothetical protein